VPAALAYKAINTMDSMIGYKHERYFYFGKAAARLDDLANFVPSRLTAGLCVLAAFVLGMSWRNAVRMILRDAKKQPSPNSGYPEAAFAGALRIRLGGTNFYDGRESRKAYLGDAERTLSVDLYSDVHRLLYGTCALALLIALALSAFTQGFL
jgi:adenosylcobinamide-phosphate synthase